MPGFCLLTEDGWLLTTEGNSVFATEDFVPVSPPSASYVSSYSLFDLQNMLSVSARNAKSSGAYSYYQKDLAIFRAMENWRRLTKQTRRLDAVTLTAGNNTAPSLPSGFLPEFNLECYLTLSGQTVRENLRIVPYTELLGAQMEGLNRTNNIPATGRPSLLAFKDRATAIVYPTPDQTYTVNFWWWEDCTSWTFGQAFIVANLSAGAIASFTVNVPGSIYLTAPTITVTDPTGAGFVAGTVTVSLGGVATIAVSNGGSGYTSPTVLVNGVAASFPVINLPNEALLPIASQGAVYYLQCSEPANTATAQAALAQFEVEAKRFAARDAGGLGVQTINRDPPAWMRGGRGFGCDRSGGVR